MEKTVKDTFLELSRIEILAYQKHSVGKKSQWKQFFEDLSDKKRKQYFLAVYVSNE